MFDPLFDVVTAVLAWFYSLWPSYGMSIAFLTLTVMVISTPFTLKGIRSMLLMQQYAPQLKKIQNEHRGDRQAMNEATMAFYREHGVNPLGGCLPMLVQAPIFLVLYRVVHGLTRRTTEIGTQLGFTSMRFSDGSIGVAPQYSETPIARSTLTFDPDFLSMDTDLYAQLSGETEMVSWGVDLSRSASAALSDSVVDALPYFSNDCSGICNWPVSTAPDTPTPEGRGHAEAAGNDYEVYSVLSCQYSPTASPLRL